MDTKLIILRGNAGSGKSTVANIIREEINDEVVYLEQDIFRRSITKALPNENFGYRRNELTKSAILWMLDWARENCNYIILDGIYSTKKYSYFFDTIKTKFTNIYAYYFDIPFDETVKRHETREKSKLFTAEEMEEWYKEKDYLPQINETIISKDLSKEEIVSLILHDIGVK